MMAIFLFYFKNPRNWWDLLDRPVSSRTSDKGRWGSDGQDQGMPKRWNKKSQVGAVIIVIHPIDVQASGHGWGATLHWKRRPWKKSTAPISRVYKKRDIFTNFQHVDTLAGNVAQKFILVVKVTSKHFSWLVNGVFNLYGYSSSSLRFFDDLSRCYVSFAPVVRRG